MKNSEQSESQRLTQQTEKPGVDAQQRRDTAGRRSPRPGDSADTRTDLGDQPMQRAPGRADEGGCGCSGSKDDSTDEATGQASTDTPKGFGDAADGDESHQPQRRGPAR